MARWTPTAEEKTCPATGGEHTVVEADTNTSHCHPRMKGICIACSQMCYTIAMDHKTFPAFYTMPAEVWSSRGIKEALRTEKQWTAKRFKARVA
jgi:hypothetical protein